ncbi:MAG: hypothetical protein AB7T63_17270 [Planctomycetota bacterium]
MMRAKTCVSCDAVLLFTAKTCTSCGAEQPDPAELRRLREAKERAFEKARREGAPSGSRGGGAGEPMSPTLRAIWIAGPCFLLGLLLQYIASRADRGHAYLLVGAWALHTAALVAALWAIIHSAVVCAIRRTRTE